MPYKTGTEKPADSYGPIGREYLKIRLSFIIKALSHQNICV
jgi:hypothetical protein